MRLSVTLDGRAHEMAQEEIQKQVAYLSSRIANVRFTSDGQVLECDVPDSEAAQLERDVRDLAGRLQKSLRRLERKIIFRSAAADRPSSPSAASPRASMRSAPVKSLSRASRWHSSAISIACSPKWATPGTPAPF